MELDKDNNTTDTAAACHEDKQRIPTLIEQTSDVESPVLADAEQVNHEARVPAPTPPDDETQSETNVPAPEVDDCRDPSDDEDEAEDEQTGPHEWDDMDVGERLERAKKLKILGNDEFSEGNYKESIKTYTLGLGFCPDTEPLFRSILFANRSAAKMKLGMKKKAIQDCTKAIEHNPKYVRALLRRAKLNEELEKLEDSLADYHKVLELDPTNREASLAAQKLPGEINEKNEKLKTEMLGKLKELGNMVLRPFGLSTDNFQLQQDPNTGSYSVNFNKT